MEAQRVSWKKTKVSVKAGSEEMMDVYRINQFVLIEQWDISV